MAKPKSLACRTSSRRALSRDRSFWLLRHHTAAATTCSTHSNVPDFLVFAAWYPKLTGAKIILDIHDLVPEFYASKFGAGRYSLAILALKAIERVSASFADHVIISNHLWRTIYASRNHLNGKCSVFINNVDSRSFLSTAPHPQRRQNHRPLPGGLQWHQGLDIAIRAFRKVRGQLPTGRIPHLRRLAT